jgi:TonB family protein
MNARLSSFARLLALVLAGCLQGAPAPAPETGGLVPCKVQQRVGVKFPVRALHEGTVRGEASLLLDVNRDGQLDDVLAVTHSGAEFAEAAIEAVRQWQFIPAHLAGEPIRSFITVNVQFEVNGVTAFTKLAGEADEPTGPAPRDNYRPFSLAELDAMPTAYSRPGPVYPKEWIESGRTGAVTVDFFIDENGNTRFARVVGNADEWLAAVAVEAIKAWQFAPPRRHGRRVLAQARQVFHFGVGRGLAR